MSGIDLLRLVLSGVVFWLLYKRIAHIESVTGIKRK